MTTINTNIEEKESKNLVKSENEQSKSKPAMITISEKNIQDVQNFIDGISDTLQEFEVLNSLFSSENKKVQDFQNELLQKLSILADANQNLSNKISGTESYEQYLEEKLKNADLSRMITSLEQQLNKEKIVVQDFINNISKKIENISNELSDKTKELQSAEETINSLLKKFKDDISNFIVEKILEIENSAKDQQKELRTSCDENEKYILAKTEEMLKSYTEKCQAHLEIIKTKSVSFLKECMEENEKLISKIPEIKTSNKFSKKDKILYTVALLSIASSAIVSVVTIIF